VSPYLFVYGTLRRGAGHPMHRFLATSSLVGDGRVHAQLFDLGSHPGMVLSRDAGDRVMGEVYELPSQGATEVLRILDEYEGVGPSGDPSPEYARQYVDVHLVTGQTVKAWAYVLVDVSRARARIASGDFMDATLVIDTPRLQLRAATPPQILTLIDDPDRFAEVAGVPADPALRGFLVSDDVSSEWLASLRQSPLADPWQHGFFVMHTADWSIIGMGGFKGAAGDDGVVEISYGVVPAYEGRGHATEIAGALTAFALDHPAVLLVRAHTLRDNPGSRRVLEKNGFRFVSDVDDPDDGPVMRWERGR
jgi:ribosomal-protein-alanine N-acetyltransferase